jgi:hypothetical protein
VQASHQGFTGFVHAGSPIPKSMNPYRQHLLWQSMNGRNMAA